MGLDGLENLGRADLGSSRNAVALKGIGHQALSISLADFSSPDSSQTGRSTDGRFQPLWS